MTELLPPFSAGPSWAWWLPGRVTVPLGGGALRVGVRNGVAPQGTAAPGPMAFPIQPGRQASQPGPVSRPAGQPRSGHRPQTCWSVPCSCSGPQVGAQRVLGSPHPQASPRPGCSVGSAALRLALGWVSD